MTVSQHSSLRLKDLLPVHSGGEELPPPPTSCSTDIHCAPCFSDHPERPERLQSILTRLSAWGLTDRCHRTPGQLRVSLDHLLPLHEVRHISTLADTPGQTQAELDRAADRLNSVFLCPESYDCALLAAGCVVEVRTMPGGGGVSVWLVRFQYLIPGFSI